MRHTEIFCDAADAVHAAGNYRPYSYRVKTKTNGWEVWEVSCGYFSEESAGIWTAGGKSRTYSNTAAFEFRTKEPGKGRCTYLFAVKPSDSNKENGGNDK